MSDADPAVLVLRDAAGDYYLLPRAWLDAARVPAAQREALTQTLDETDTAGFTAAGFVPFTALAVLPEGTVQKLWNAANFRLSLDGPGRS